MKKWKNEQRGKGKKEKMDKRNSKINLNTYMFIL